MLICAEGTTGFGNQDKEAAEYFKKAIALQPDYALGWAGLSDYYGKAVIDGELTPGEANPPGEFAAKKALQLDDSLSTRIFPWPGCV